MSSLYFDESLETRRLAEVRVWPVHCWVIWPTAWMDDLNIMTPNMTERTRIYAEARWLLSQCQLCARCICLFAQNDFFLMMPNCKLLCNLKIICLQNARRQHQHMFDRFLNFELGHGYIHHH